MGNNFKKVIDIGSKQLLSLVGSVDDNFL